MLVMSCSMTKAGSGWYHSMTNDLLVAAGHQDKVQVRDQHGLGDILEYDNCHLSRPNLLKIRRLVRVGDQGNTYCVHVHCGPIPSVRYYMGRSRIRATYIYRDPRDVVVSAYRHGVRERQAGLLVSNFAKLRTIRIAAYWVRWRQLPRYAAWRRTDPRHVLMTRYEDLLADPVAELERLVGFLDLDVPAAILPGIVDRYSRNRGAARRQPGLHFDRGVAGRFREELTGSEIALCNRIFRPYLIAMGYPLAAA